MALIVRDAFKHVDESRLNVVASVIAFERRVDVVRPREVTDAVRELEDGIVR